MEQWDNIANILALTMGVAWASGINLYATVFVLGLLSNTGHVQLPADLQLLGDPLVMTAAGFMYFIEFFADKIPGVDTGWDAVQTFIRIPAGAVLAAGAMADVGPAAGVAAAIVGGGLTAATHAAKAGTRVMINTSPEPVTNWTASIGEDLAVIAGLWTALNHPWLFLALLGLFIGLMVWLLPRLWRGVTSLMRRIRNLFSGERPAAGAGPPADLPRLKDPSFTIDRQDTP